MRDEEETVREFIFPEKEKDGEGGEEGKRRELLLCKHTCTHEYMYTQVHTGSQESRGCALAILPGS